MPIGILNTNKFFIAVKGHLIKAAFAKVKTALTERPTKKTQKTK